MDKLLIDIDKVLDQAEESEKNQQQTTNYAFNQTNCLSLKDELNTSINTSINSSISTPNYHQQTNAYSSAINNSIYESNYEPAYESFKKLDLNKAEQSLNDHNLSSNKSSSLSDKLISSNSKSSYSIQQSNSLLDNSNDQLTSAFLDNDDKILNYQNKPLNACEQSKMQFDELINESSDKILNDNCFNLANQNLVDCNEDSQLLIDINDDANDNINNTINNDRLDVKVIRNEQIINLMNDNQNSISLKDELLTIEKKGMLLVKPICFFSF